MNKVVKTTRRRSFLKGAALGVTAWSLRGPARGAVPDPDRLVVAVIGVGGMGKAHLRELAGRKDVDVSHVCDVDRNHLGEAVKTVESAGGKRPRAVKDLREVLDDTRLQAVFIATPDHWHAPASLLAMEAGKHVYVEKPCSHNIREGRLLVEASKRTGKLVQVGTQSRSTSCVREGVEKVLRGEIGEVLVAKAWNSQLRSSIGKVKPSAPPEHLDFDLWLGPAPETPYRSNLLPGVWRWWHRFGCGDIGNDGVHDLDVACWGLGVTTHPSHAVCLGGKHFFDDDQEFPDTQYAVFEYPGKSAKERTRQLVFEQRTWSPYVQEGYENGAAFYGTKGVMLIGHSVGWKLYGARNKVIAERTGEPDLRAHHDNFFRCIRGEEKTLAADAAAGHRAATLVHLANIAARVRRAIAFDPDREEVQADREAGAMVRREYRPGHWAMPKGLEA